MVILRELRSRTGITLETLANLCDVSMAHMSFIERGMRRPHLDKAKHIVDVLARLTGEKLTIDNLFFHEGDLLNTERHKAENIAKIENIKKELELKEKIKELQKEINKLKN